MKMNEFKEPVRIRLKNLKSGCKSIYLDFYMKGRKREYKFLNLYLHPELSKEDKEWNKRQLQLANAIKSRYIIQIQNREYGFHDNEQSSKSNFIEYCRHLIDEYRKNHQNSCAVLLEYAVKRMIRYKGENITFEDIDKKFLVGFIDFLNRDIRDFDRKPSAKCRMARPISEGYKVVIYARIMTALNKAVRENIITINPGKNIENKIKPKKVQNTRCYLTLEEIQKLINLPYRIKNDVKRAFLFCCFCGLRFSDVRQIRWKDIKKGKDGFMQLETRIQKTKQDLYLPLSDNAIRWLPEKGETNEDEMIFSNLPKQASHADQILKTLIRKAGINKHVTFHVARHTFATLTLSFGADIYTISKLLGHTKIETTQIYAKIVDENKRKAVNLIPRCDFTART